MCKIANLGVTELGCVLSDWKDTIFVTYHGYVLFFMTMNDTKTGKGLLHLYTLCSPAGA